MSETGHYAKCDEYKRAIAWKIGIGLRDCAECICDIVATLRAYRQYKKANKLRRFKQENKRQVLK